MEKEKFTGWTEEQCAKAKEWLQSPEGIASLKEMQEKNKKQLESLSNRLEDAQWWLKIKDMPYMGM